MMLIGILRFGSLLAIMVYLALVVGAVHTLLEMIG